MFFRLCPAEESQIQDQTRAWIYPKFQSFTSGIQKDDSRQGIAFEIIDFWPPAPKVEKYQKYICIISIAPKMCCVLS